MKFIVKSTIFTLAVTALAITVFPAAAQLDLLPDADCGTLGLQCGDGQPSSLANILQTIINVFLALIAVIAVAAIIYGGVQYMISGGDEQQAAKGKRTVLFAVVGLLIVGLAAAIVQFTGGALKGRTTKLPDMIFTIIKVFLALIAVIDLAAIIYGGVQYMISGGDEQQAAKGKRTVLYAVAGLIIVGLAFAIVVFTAGAIRGETMALPDMILTIINVFLVLVSLAALIAIIYGGVQYITSEGDEQKSATAKRTILYAVLGLLVTGFAAAIVAFVNEAVVGRVTNLPGLIWTTLNVLMVLVGLGAIVFIIIGGARYIASQGDEQASAQAKNTILYAVLGLIVIGLAAAVVNFVLWAIVRNNLPYG
ncbi:MAG: hypothetical protein Q8P73_00770 [bacterium]|nr:hypothetical protein [bacterium]